MTAGLLWPPCARLGLDSRWLCSWYIPIGYLACQSQNITFQLVFGRTLSDLPIFLLSNQGQLYVMGGSNGHSDELSCGETYNPTTDEWSQVPELRTNRCNAGKQLSPYCCTRQFKFAQHLNVRRTWGCFMLHIYKVKRLSLSNSLQFQNVATNLSLKLSVPRLEFQCDPLVVFKKIMQGHSSCWAVLKSVQWFWYWTKSLDDFIPGVCSLSNKLYVVGGSDPCGQKGLKNCDAFDPVTKLWNSCAPLNISKFFSLSYSLAHKAGACSSVNYALHQWFSIFSE